MSNTVKKNAFNLPYRIEPSNLPHVFWVDLYGNGIAVEIIVVAFNKGNGDLYFIRTDHLDGIDKNRLLRILSRRDAARYELWDLLSQQTLGNGMNALEFFDQFVKVKLATGQIVSKSSGFKGFQTSFSEAVSFAAPVQEAKESTSADVQAETTTKKAKSAQ